MKTHIHMPVAKERQHKAFVKLDEPLSLASSFKRVVKTAVHGREVGWGCSLQK